MDKFFWTVVTNTLFVWRELTEKTGEKGQDSSSEISITLHKA